MEEKMKIEIWSDIVCPFCYIGKRNFEKGLAAFSNPDAVEIEWKSYQLDPTAPEYPSTEPYAQMLAEKYGWTLEKAQQQIDSMTEMANAAGLDYKLEKIKRLNTFNTHRIIQLAKTKAVGDQAEEAFFKAYFIEGKDLSEKETQIKILESIGLTEEDLEQALNKDIYADAVHADIQEAKQIGVQGVPFFVLNRKYAISGAQAPEGFLEAIETAYKEWKEESA